MTRFASAAGPIGLFGLVSLTSCVPPEQHRKVLSERRALGQQVADLVRFNTQLQDEKLRLEGEVQRMSPLIVDATALANQKKQLARSLSEDAFPVEKVEGFFVGYLLATCEVPDNQALRPMLSGNSVHGDYRYIKHHMPALDELLSFRLVDVTTLKELARRWCPKLVFSKNGETIRASYPGEIELKGTAHDALYDIKGSIAELAFYRKHLFGKAAQ